MKAHGLPFWLFLVVGAGIAVVALAIAQFAHGAGMPFVLLATAAWMIVVQHRARMNVRG